VTDLKRSYSLGIGRLRLDLRDVELPAGETHVRTRLDVGRITVVAPTDAALQVHGNAHFGDVKILGSENDGHDIHKSVIETGKRVLVLDSRVGAGEIVVSRAVR
jgi:predicted membrane protein